MGIVGLDELTFSYLLYRSPFAPCLACSLDS